MGQYNGAVITTAGQAVLAQAIGGAELTITKVVTSATAIPPGTDLTALTTIADVEQMEQPTSVQVFNDNIVQISTRFSNAGVAAAYLIQTLGVFGQVTGGAETLLAVSTAITPDQMPVEDAIAPSAFIYNIQLTVQSADQITVTVNDAGTATVADVQALDEAKLDKDGDGASVTVTFDETADPDVTSFATFLSSIVSGLSLSKLLRVIKTGLSYIAPKNHAADDVTTYGGGDATNYGHVRLSDVYNSQIGTAAQSIGASQKAVYDAYDALNSKFNMMYVENTSVNMLTENGTFFCYQCANIPIFDQIDTWILTVNKYSNTYVKQTARAANQYSRSLLILERTYTSNGWSGWNILKNFVADSKKLSDDYEYYVKFGNSQYGSAIIAGTFGGIGAVLLGITISNGSIASVQNLMTGSPWSNAALSIAYAINSNDSRGYFGLKTTSTSSSNFTITSF
jgi:hypothetical protein